MAHGTRDVAVIIGSDDIIAALEESQITLGNIKGSRFSLPIKVNFRIRIGGSDDYVPINFHAWMTALKNRLIFH